VAKKTGAELRGIKLKEIKNPFELYDSEKLFEFICDLLPIFVST